MGALPKALWGRGGLPGHAEDVLAKRGAAACMNVEAIIQASVEYKSIGGWWISSFFLNFVSAPGLSPFLLIETDVTSNEPTTHLDTADLVIGEDQDMIRLFDE